MKTLLTTTALLLCLSLIPIFHPCKIAENPAESEICTGIGPVTGFKTGNLYSPESASRYFARADAARIDGMLFESINLFYTISPANTYYLSPSGSDSRGRGTIESPWHTITKAMRFAAGGDVVYMRGGKYNYTTVQEIKNKNGSAENYINIWAYPGEKPVINAAEGYTFNEGIYIEDSGYIYLKGLEVTGYTQPAGDEWGHGIYATDVSHCIFENLDVHHNCFGMSLVDDDGISDGNLILNCDFHHSEDPKTSFPPPYDNLFPYGNADGLTIRLDANGDGTTNSVRGCRFWYCSDDGIDLWSNEGLIILDNCWAFWNGLYADTFNTCPGDGNGFKLGLTYKSATSSVLRQVHNCIAYRNTAWGFVRNGALCNMEIYNNTAYFNGSSGTGYSGGFFFGNDGKGGDIPFFLKNNISYNNYGSNASYTLTSNMDHNTWDPGVKVTDADFLSIIPAGIDGKREPDGSLPVTDFLRLAAGSDLIDAGIDVGFEYRGSNPDLGAFEFQGVFVQTKIVQF